MQEIQRLCALLRRHRDQKIARAGWQIQQFDQQREEEHLVFLQKKDETIASQTAALKSQEQIIDLLQFQLGNANADRFGPSSEQDDKKKSEKRKPAVKPQGDTASSEQVSDNDNSESPDSVDANGAVKREGQGKGRKDFPAHLRRIPHRIRPDSSQYCACGCGRRMLPPKIFERLEIIPAKPIVIQEIHEKSVCKNCAQVAYPRHPDRVFEGSRYGTSLSVAALIDKFDDGLPYYRQARRYARAGFDIERSTLMRMAQRAATFLTPIHDLMEQSLRNSTVLHMDETPLPQLDPGRGKVKTGYLWTLMRDQNPHKGNEPPCVVFNYASRAGINAEEILRGFCGFLHVDGYAGYNGLTDPARPEGPVYLSYCWAHVRRKFREVNRAGKSKLAQECLKLINRMFMIERDIKSAPAIVRRATRQQETLLIVDELFELMKRGSLAGLRQSAMGKALNYAITLEDGLRRFLDDGRLEISNNPVENIIRHVAIVRKNALFAGSEVGAEHWGIIQSIISTCRLNNIDPHEYLTWVFKQMEGKLPRSQYHKLLPWNCPLRRNVKKK